MLSKRTFAAVGLCLTRTLAAAQGETTNCPAPALWERPTLTGDWGGLRSRAADHGFDFGLEYTGEVLGNTSGGLERAGLYQGIFKGFADVNPEPLTGWRGAHLHACALWIAGSEPNCHYDIAGLTGSAYSDPSNISAYDTVRLVELWLEQTFWNGKVSLKLGQMALDEEFICNDYAAVFISGTHGWPAFVGSTLPFGGQSYPLAGTGARLTLRPSDNLHFQAALADGDVQDQTTRNRHGTHLGFHGADSLLALAELAYHRNEQTGATGLPGCYKLGAWYYTGDFPDLSHDTAGRSLQDDGTLSGFPSTGQPAMHPGNGGFYLDVCQLLWRKKADTDQGLGLYARVAPWLPDDRNPLDFYAAAGLNFKGLLPARAADVFGLGVNYAHVSSSLRDAQSAANRITALGGTPNSLTAGPVPDYEMSVEMTYQIQLSPWWYMQPDVQYIFHPGGSSAIQDAVVVGLRTKIVF